jgi:hypothetical protein
MATRKTSAKVATKSSSVLRSGRTSPKSKSAAGSALSQTGTRKKTGAKAASKASSTLRDGRTGTKSKSAAGSALSQKKSGGR